MSQWVWLMNQCNVWHLTTTRKSWETAGQKRKTQVRRGDNRVFFSHFFDCVNTHRVGSTICRQLRSLWGRLLFEGRGGRDGWRLVFSGSADICQSGQTFIRRSFMDVCPLSHSWPEWSTQRQSEGSNPCEEHSGEFHHTTEAFALQPLE